MNLLYCCTQCNWTNIWQQAFFYFVLFVNISPGCSLLKLLLFSQLWKMHEHLILSYPFPFLFWENTDVVTVKGCFLLGVSLSQGPWMWPNVLVGCDGAPMKHLKPVSICTDLSDVCAFLCVFVSVRLVCNLLKIYVHPALPPALPQACDCVHYCTLSVHYCLSIVVCCLISADSLATS